MVDREFSHIHLPPLNTPVISTPKSVSRKVSNGNGRHPFFAFYPCQHCGTTYVYGAKSLTDFIPYEPQMVVPALFKLRCSGSQCDGGLFHRCATPGPVPENLHEEYQRLVLPDIYKPTIYKDLQYMTSLVVN